MIRTVVASSLRHIVIILILVYVDSISKTRNIGILCLKDTLGYQAQRFISTMKIFACSHWEIKSILKHSDLYEHVFKIDECIIDFIDEPRSRRPL